MTALAQLSDVEALLQRTISDSGQQAWVATLLERASDEFRRATGQTISVVEGDTLDLVDVPSGPDLWLPQRPVTAINSITVNGTVADPSTYRWWSSGLVRLTTSCGSWRGYPTTLPSLVVDYDHGWAATPGDVALRVAQLVVDTLSNPTGAKSLTIDGYGATFGGTRMVLADDDPIVVAYRPPVLSIPMRFDDDQPLRSW